MNAVQCITLELFRVSGLDIFLGVVIPILFVELKSLRAVSALRVLGDCA